MWLWAVFQDHGRMCQLQALEERSEGMVMVQFIVEALNTAETCWGLETSCSCVCKRRFLQGCTRVRRYLLLPFLPCHPLQHSLPRSHNTRVMQLTLFIQARLVLPCFQTTFCKSPLHFAGGPFGCRTVQNREDLKHSLSPISHELRARSCRNTVLNISSSSPLNKTDAQEGYTLLCEEKIVQRGMVR